MTYAMVWIALSLGVGITLASRFALSMQALWIASTSILAIVVVVRILPRTVRMAGLLCVACLVGALRQSTAPAFPEWLLRRAPGLSEVTGIVVSYPDVGETSISFTLAPDQLPGFLIVHASCSNPVSLVHYGDSVCVRGSARLPTAFDGFDYAGYLARQNIFATLFADEIVPGQSATGSIRTWGDRLRQRLLGKFRAVLRFDIAALAQSLLFGDRSALSDDAEEAFSRTGLMHLLAVSGLHLSIFLGGAWWALRRLGARPRVAYPLVGSLVILALVVVGPRVSLVRAGWLFAFLALGSVLADCGFILRRWIHPLNGLAAAAIAILLARPGALLDSGFQLTMAATASILLAFSPTGWATKCGQAFSSNSAWRLWVIRLLLVSAAAQAGAAPIIAWHFQSFHPLGILVNLMAVPWAAASLWAGLCALVLAATPLFGVVSLPFSALLHGLEVMVRGLSKIPCVQLPVMPGLGVWMAGCVGFLVLAYYFVSLSSWTSNSTSMAPGSRGD